LIANGVDQISKVWARASKNVLIEEEKRLDGANLAVRVLQRKIQIFELGRIVSFNRS